MSASLRYCAHCAEPLAGRADKVYCTSSCKSKDFRRQQAAAAGRPADDEDPDGAVDDAYEAENDAPAPVPARPSAAPNAPGRAPSPPAAPFSWQELMDQAVEQHGLAQLPRQYAACIERVLAADERPLDGRDLARLGTPVTQAIAAHQRLAHGPDRPAFLARHLEDLYRVADIVAEAAAEWDEEREPVALGLKKKFRAQLRTALALLARP